MSQARLASTDVALALPLPGVDPVVDHTWCCEHPEPYHYFRMEALSRLLSGLARVFRVDPVETAWSLRIAAWAAAEEALPVLSLMLADEGLTPGLRREAEALLASVSPDAHWQAQPGAHTSGEASALPDTVDGLLAALRSASEVAVRHSLAEELARIARLSPPSERAAVLVELLGEGTPHAHELWSRWFASDAAATCSEAQRAHLALALASAPEPWSRLAAVEIVERLPNGASAYDVYEIVRALDRTPRAGDEVRSRLRQVLQGRAWWKDAASREPTLALVVAAALGAPGTDAQIRAACRPIFSAPVWRRTTGRRALAEAMGHTPAVAQVAGLRRWLFDSGLGVRREAARSLWRLTTPAATAALFAHLNKAVRRNRALLDIEGVDVVRYAVDAVLRDRHAGAADLVAALLTEPSTHVHDLGDRLALTLAAMEDPRCFALHPEAAMPWALHAALTPIPLSPWETLRDPVRSVAHLMEAVLETSLDIPVGPLSHLDRVHLQRRMMAAWDEPQGRQTLGSASDAGSPHIARAIRGHRAVDDVAAAP